jgi:para-aminobenzoate synthetase/4-amino-4-deoxychorismate lyase
VSAPRPDRQRGVFETLLVLGGKAVELEPHLARLEASLRSLFPDREPPSGLARKLEAEVAGLALGAVRVTVAPDGGEALRIAIEEVEVEPDRILPPGPAAIDAHTLTVHGGLGGHKWADRTFLDRARKGLGANDALLILDWDDALLEASRANAFAAFGGTLLTPPADGRILPGITRSRAIEAAAEAGLEVRETTLLREDLTGADELFLTSSVRGVELIRRLDGTELKPAGEVASMIHATLRRTWTGTGLDRVPRR